MSDIQERTDDELDNILRHAIYGGNHQFDGSEQEKRLEVCKALIQDRERQARLDEWDYIDEMRDVAHDAMTRCRIDRIAELQSEATKQPRNLSKEYDDYHKRIFDTGESGGME